MGWCLHTTSLSMNSIFHRKYIQKRLPCKYRLFCFNSLGEFIVSEPVFTHKQSHCSGFWTCIFFTYVQLFHQVQNVSSSKGTCTLYMVPTDWPQEERYLQSRDTLEPQILFFNCVWQILNPLIHLFFLCVSSSFLCREKLPTYNICTLTHVQKTTLQLKRTHIFLLLLYNLLFHICSNLKH